MAELTKRGANLCELHKSKREATAILPELLHLKGKLLQSVEFHVDGRLAIAEINPDTVARYKDISEPYTLILNEMQWTKGVELVAVFKIMAAKSMSRCVLLPALLVPWPKNLVAAVIPMPEPIAVKVPMSELKLTY
ncbi:hypothetical protein IPG36_04920 [bacterium]|nr:MAG: hypothetical protein IPG36_04920 [bacterium]